MKLPICIDFETEAIEDRPRYPPKPVGVAVKMPGKPGRYYAWDHPTKNSATKEKAREVLRDIWASGEPLLFHNAKFDLEVAERHFGLKLPPWDRVHDTLYLLFLKDPYAPTLSLKPSAERLLGLAPEEQDAVADWLRAQGVITAKQGPEAFICKAPGDIVGRYAIGDVDRTVGLFKKLHPGLDAKEREAYDRERKLMPILLRNEQEGLRLDTGRMEVDLPAYEKALATCEGWIQKRLKSKDLNIDDDKSVGDALYDQKIVVDWVWTKGGNGRAPQRSVAKANLGAERFTDKRVFHALDYRNRLHTVLSMSMRPWLAQADGSGRIYTSWNQVRQSHGANDTIGARTGRLSASRFMNVSKKFAGHVHPEFIKGLPPLPLVRRYLLPEPGHVWLHRDYKQQEPRVLGHFEGGSLMEAFKTNPTMDVHDDTLAALKGMGYEATRDQAKMTFLATIYALGVSTLSLKLGIPKEAAAQLRSGIKQAWPDVAVLEQEVKSRGRAGDYVREWGGGKIYCEAPAVAKKGPRAGEEVTFEYKMLNHLIQRSSASCTKESIIRYDELRRDSRLLVTVHDENNISAPVKAADREDRLLREAMESVKFDVPMLTDPKRGPNWGELEKIK